MALDTNITISAKPGQEIAGPISHRLRINPSEKRFGSQPANRLAEMFGADFHVEIAPDRFIPGLSGSTTQTSGQYKADYDTGGLVQWAPTGLALVTGSGSGNKVTLTNLVTLAGGLYADKWVSFLLKIKSQAVANTGFWVGVGNVGTDPIGSEPANYFAFSKPVGTADINGAIRGNSGTSVSQQLVQTSVDDTFVEIGMRLFLSATKPAGAFFVGSNPAIPLTAAQLTQLAAIITGNATLGFMAQAKTNTAAARQVTIARAKLSIG